MQELCKAINSVWNGSMVPERKGGGNFGKERVNHGESNVWSTVQR